MVQGQAASVLSDVYGLGAVLYELLTGHPPHGTLAGPALRRAVVEGVVVPVRAVAPMVPRALAELTHRLLMADPARRPGSVDEVIEALGAAGYPVLRGPAGQPPLLGRHRELELLGEFLAGEPGVLAVTGPPGSGRERLVREALDQASADLRVLDLRNAPHRASALHAALGLPDDVDPSGTEVWADQARDTLIERDDAGYDVVALGRFVDDPTCQALAAAMSGVVACGGRVVWTSDRPVFGGRTLPLPALRPVDLEAIGRFASVGGEELSALVARSEGLAGTFLELVDLARGGGGQMPAVAVALRDELLTLPPSVPARFVDALRERRGEALALLLLHGGARLQADGCLVVGAYQDVDIHRGLERLVDAHLDSEMSTLDPLWDALVAARRGRLEMARLGFGLAVAHEGPRRREAFELLRRLGAAGDADARRAYAQRCLLSGLYGEAARWLEGDERPDALASLLQALWRADRFEAGEALFAQFRDQLTGDARVAFLVEGALLANRQQHFDDAEARVAEAALAAGSDVRPEVLRARLIVLTRRRTLGERVDLTPVLHAASEVVDQLDLDARAMFAVARAMLQAGQLDRAAAMYARSARCADVEGDLHTSATSRLSGATVELKRDRLDQARPLLEEAILFARAHGEHALVGRASYMLAEMDLALGRLPSAERHLEDFAEVAPLLVSAGSHQRLAYLRGLLELERGRPQAALRELERDPDDTWPSSLEAIRRYLVAEALLDLDRPEEAMAAFPEVPQDAHAILERHHKSVHGRAHMRIGRRLLDEAVAELPEEPEKGMRRDVGRLLLAHAGEDLDPSSFGWRRTELERAAHLLSGQESGLAATLRDRLLAEPGAPLESIVDLVESLGKGPEFLDALARMIGEAMGAHRVLIMVRIAGLGRQERVRELSREEAGGISKQVSLRIRRPGDVWYSADALADTELRQASLTVQTFKIKSLLAVAVPFEGRAIGALYVDDVRRVRRFSEADVALLQRIARAMGNVIGRLGTPTRRRSLDPIDVGGVLLSDDVAVRTMRDALEALRHMPQANILLTGPTGAGKTVFARRLAKEVLGLRGLEEVSLQAAPPERLVGLLQGTRVGDFTGAVQRDGAIDRALRGRRALFLDEVQSLTADGQQALLPLFEEPRRFGAMVGSTHQLKDPLHVITATNAVTAGTHWKERFQDAFWYRISQIHIELPSLFDRGPEAVFRYLADMLAKRGLDGPEHIFDTATLASLTTAQWPGNLRQLENFAGRVAALHAVLQRRITQADLARRGLGPEVDDEPTSRPLAGSMDDIVQRAVVDALGRNGWNQAGAARDLGWTRFKMHRTLKRLGLLDEVRRRRGGPGQGDEGEESVEDSTWPAVNLVENGFQIRIGRLWDRRGRSP